VLPGPWEGPRTRALLVRPLRPRRAGERQVAVHNLGMNTMPLPNKRLKLTGGDRFKGSGVLGPGGARTVVHYPCAGGRVARSLSAIR